MFTLKDTTTRFLSFKVALTTEFFDHNVDDCSNLKLLTLPIKSELHFKFNVTVNVISIRKKRMVRTVFA